MRKSRGIYIDRGYIFIRIWPHGKTNPAYRECFGPLNRDNLEIAEFKLRKYRNQIMLGEFGIPDKIQTLTVAESCDLYLEKHANKLSSLGECQRVINRLKDRWSGRTIDSITLEDVERFREWRSGEGDSGSTINRQHVVITSLFSKLERWVKTKEIQRVKLPENNPGSLVQKANESESTRRRVLSVEEFDRLLDVATPRGRDIYLMAVNSLLRKKDLMNVCKEYINENTGEIRGLQSKTGKPYSVVINEPIADILAKVESGTVLDFENFQKEFNAARKAANIKGFQFRDLRRTGATRLLKDGEDLGTISRMLGHATIQMTEHYIGVVKEDNKRAAALLARRFKSPKNGLSSDVNSDVKRFVSSSSGSIKQSEI